MQIDNILETVLKEYNSFNLGDIVSLDSGTYTNSQGNLIPTGSRGRITTVAGPDSYIVTFTDQYGESVDVNVAGEDLIYDTPAEVAVAWDGNMATDILTHDEWKQLYKMHPEIYKQAMRQRETALERQINDEVWEYLNKNWPEAITDYRPTYFVDNLVFNNDSGPMTDYMRPGEELNDTILRAKNNALYVTDNLEYVVWSI